MSPQAPTATYRLQLRNGLTLDDVIELGWLEHIAELGVSHVYLSPVLRAVPGSSHGYDVVDPRAVDPALGADEALQRVAEHAGELGLALVLDIVPNHMAADQVANPWWWDVLRNGDDSEHAATFDLDPVHPEQRLRGSIFLPVLDDHYGRVLEAGRIRVARRPTDIVVTVDDRPFPLEPASLGAVLAPLADARSDDLLLLVAHGYRRVSEEPSARAAELRVLDAFLAQCLADEQLTESLEVLLVELNADADAMHVLLEAQQYRLAYWRAARDLGYRRFFDVNELIGIRVELPEVFDRTHGAIEQWVRDGLVAGLRVDHPDGLRAPAAYFDRLHEMFPDGWVVAEKILEPGEELREDWAVHGTTGYDVAEVLARWFIDPTGLDRLGELSERLVGGTSSAVELVEDCKRLVLSEVLAADLNRATDAFLRLCESLRRYRDVTRHEVHEVLREVVVAYPVYRTYVAAGHRADAIDRRIIASTLARVGELRPDLDPEVIELLGEVLRGALDDESVLAPVVRTRVEQLTGPAMAKGKEDTAFYRHVRLIGRCEVGSDPDAPGLDAAALHDRLQRVQERTPLTMTSLSTHDSKRSEDVRARLSVLSEQPEAWRTAAEAWMQRADALDPEQRVDTRTRYLCVQTMVGAHPVDTDRLEAFALKAVREAKDQTSWLHPDPDYEAAVAAFARAVVADRECAHVVDTLVREVVDPAGRMLGLAQKVLQLCAPGVPDLYWGSEDWLHRLVDPDNRTAPDLDRLRALVAETSGSATSSAAKAHAVRTVLALRARRPECFGVGGTYRPLDVAGADADRVVAFLRGEDVAVVVTRWPSRGQVDGSTSVALPAGEWRVVLGAGRGEWAADGAVAVRSLTGDWPVAVLERITEP
jgi:(1->4)-alpha-D-glucan 1-alpha-D-glucosylmutase